MLTYTCRTTMCNRITLLRPSLDIQYNKLLLVRGYNNLIMTIDIGISENRTHLVELIRTMPDGVTTNP